MVIRRLLSLKDSLRARLMLSSVAVCALALGILVSSSAHFLESQLEEQTRIRVQMMEDAYGTAIAMMLFSRDYASLREILEGWQDNDKVLYMVVTSADGETRITANWPEDALLPAPGHDREAQVWHVAHPVKFADEVYGQLYFGLSTRFIEEARHEILMREMSIALAGLLFLVVLLSFCIYWLTQRLVRLSEASERLGRGDFTQPLVVPGHDEVAVLAENFNAMIRMVESRMLALRKSEERFRAIADYTYDWENWFGVDGQLCWVNPAVQRIVGYTPEECLVMPDFPLSLVHPDDHGLIRFQMQLASEGMSGQNLEFRIQCKDGHTIWAAVSWQPIHDDQGASLGYRSSIRDITSQHHASEELAYQAIHDPLTGLFNRRAFEHRLERVVSSMGKEKQRLPVALLFIDLDQFKMVNDTCGHAAGDKLLTSLVGLLQQKVDAGFLARLGGDEFGVILRCDEIEAIACANRIINEIRAYTFNYEGHSFHIGASIGVVQATESMKDAAELMIAADTACYAAKERGRNRVELYATSDEYFRLRHEEFRSVNHVNNALEEGRFMLYYQRISPLKPGLRPHAEILIRLKDEASGEILPPARFIAAAERFNLMPHIDHWVVENVCRRMAELEARGAGREIGRFAVNISGATLSDPDFLDFVRSQVERYAVAPERLCFEITEGCAVGKLEQAMKFIEGLRDMRIALALDDFGTGLSSLAYLKRFKVDYMKIDGLFVRNLEKDDTDKTVVTAMVALARANGLETIAEFTHNEAVLEIVRSLGVDYAQGYVCHIPEPLDHLGR
jgi:diguanylate cyclase (GGDEF)-like protein/PAS domain S-box-containing protein